MKLKHLITLTAFASCALQGAQAQSLDNIFRKFSQCDSSFHKAMKDEAQVALALAPTDSKGDAMWFKVPSRGDEKTGVVALAGKPTIAGLPVASYVDYVTDIGDAGLYYTWGFKVRGDLAATVGSLKPFIFENDRLRKDESAYVRTELKTGTSAWLPIKTDGGTVPKTGTVERAFLIEPDEDKSLVMVTCTIQGSVDATHLKELRPDIDAKEYPKKPEVVTFESVNIAPELMAKLQVAVKAQPLFMPKFKKAVVSYKTVSAKGGFETTDTLIHSQAGVLDVLEDSRFVKFKRQYIANYDVLQSKYGYINPKGELFMGVLVAKDGTLEFAKNLIKGEIAFKSTVTAYRVPVPDEKDKSWTQVCTTAETVPASDVFSKFFSKLPGRAILFNCVTDGKVNEASGYALIEDYGLVLPYELPETNREFKRVYTSITIER